MKAPSEKALLASFRDLDRKQAKLIRAFAKAEDNPEKLEKLVEKVPATEAYVRSLYSDPYRTGIWRTTVALHAINDIVGGYGVEALGPEDPHRGYAPAYEYINFGDPYVATLIYDRDKDRLYIGDWGSIVEEEDPEGEWNGTRGNGGRRKTPRQKRKGTPRERQEKPKTPRRNEPAPKSRTAQRILRAAARKDR